MATDNQPDTVNNSANALNVFVLGATGTAGLATVKALLQAGHRVTCFVRSGKHNETEHDIRQQLQLPASAGIRLGDISNAESLGKNGFQGESFDALVSCIASRTGATNDAWAIDYQANMNALSVAREAGVRHMILLSAICVQKPLLAFQHAKLAFEKELIKSGIRYSIIRPTAFFKSLSGQVDRVRQGKPFLVFGDGTLTACKPISDADLGNYIASCLVDDQRYDQILPIGGPGPAITPRQQGEWLFEMTGQTPKFRQVPVAFLNTIQHILAMLGKVSSRCAEKAEFAKIGRYYATESMLLLNPETNEYDAASTPSTGSETLRDFYAALLDGTVSVKLGDHAMFREQENHHVDEKRPDLLSESRQSSSGKDRIEAE